jgi:hypothetical protein
VCFLTRINFLQFSFFLSYLFSHTNRWKPIMIPYLTQLGI